MPQEHPRNESHRSDSPRSESPRSEHLRGEKSGVGSAVNVQVAEMGAKSVTAGLRMQKELFETFQDISRDWFARDVGGGVGIQAAAAADQCALGARRNVCVPGMAERMAEHVWRGRAAPHL